MCARTQEELLQRYNSRKENDFLGFEANEYLYRMDFETAKTTGRLNEETTKEEWEGSVTDKTLLEVMQDYIDFAYGKAESERGISANRSIMHYIAWSWLNGDTEFSKQIEDEFENNYHSYGKNILDMIVEYYNLKVDNESC